MPEIRAIISERLKDLSLSELDDPRVDRCIERAINELLTHVEELDEQANYLVAEIATGLLIKDDLMAKGERDVTSVKEGLVSASYKAGTSLWDIAEEYSRITEYKISKYRRILW